MDSRNPVNSFNRFKVDLDTKNKLKAKLRNDVRLADIQNYLDNNPELVEHVIKLNIFQNLNNERNEEELFNNIVSQIRNVYNKSSERREATQVRTINDNDVEGEGIQLTNLKKGSNGGKTKRKKQIRKRSKFNNRPTPRYKKKTLRKKRKQNKK
jgi:hypothetical protein